MSEWGWKGFGVKSSGVFSVKGGGGGGGARAVLCGRVHRLPALLCAVGLVEVVKVNARPAPSPQESSYHGRLRRGKGCHKI